MDQQEYSKAKKGSKPRPAIEQGEGRWCPVRLMVLKVGSVRAKGIVECEGRR